MSRAADSVLLLQVPAAEFAVSRHRARWDFSAAFGVPAHVTVVYPFMPPNLIDAGVLNQLADLFAPIPAFDLLLTSCAWFDERVLWLTPEDPRPIIGLTEAVSSAFPAYLPYEGRFPDVVPHLTVGDTGTPSDLAGVEAAVSPLLPIRARVAEVGLFQSEGDPTLYRLRAQFNLARPWS